MASTDVKLVPSDENLFPAEVESRTERARKLHEQIIGWCNKFYQGWYEIAAALAPIRDDELYKELGYKTWAEYTVDVFGKQPTSINNHLSPYDGLRKAGLNPADYKDIYPSRVEKLAEIAIATGGQLDPELLEKARVTGSRAAAKEFNTAVAVKKEKLHLESGVKLVIGMSASQHRQFSVALEILGELRGKVCKPLDFIEELIVDFVQRPDVIEVMRRRPELLNKLQAVSNEG